MEIAQEFLLGGEEERARGFLLGKQPQVISAPILPAIEPPPFDIDSYIDGWIMTQPKKNPSELREEFAGTFAPMIRPLFAQGYNAASALNRGIGVFSEHLDTIGTWLESKELGKKEGIFKTIANNYNTYSDYWKDRANKVGINFIDELVSEAVGGAIPGIAEFILNIPYAAILGAAKAQEREENELLGALVEGGKRGVLGGIFEALGPLKQYLRAPGMGTVFGIQTAAEGGEPKEIAKSIGAGALYSLSSPGGQMGLNELRGRIERQIPKPTILIPEKNILQIDPKVKEIIDNKARMVEPKAKFEVPIIERGFEVAKPEEFITAREKTKYSQFLTPYSIEDLAKFEIYLLKDKDIGYALNPEKDLINILNNSGINGLGKEAVIDAINKGAKTLNCFDTGLKEYYEGFGFKEYKRELWNEKFAPKDWDLTIYGTPDIIYMRFEGVTRDPRDIRRITESLEFRPKGIAGRPISIGRPSEIRPEPFGPEREELLRYPRGPEEPLIKPSFPPEPLIPTLLEQFPKREGEPEIRDRKYWKTVEESERTVEGAKFVMEEIQKEEPQINIVQPNRESLEKAYTTLEEKGFENTVEYIYESKDLKPVEKGALFNVLMEASQKVGDWARFTEIMDSYSLYLVDLGRGVQIASVWNKATPQGFIKWAEKQLDAVNKKYGWFDTILGRKKTVLSEQDKIFMVQELSRIQKMPEGIEKSNEMLKLIDFVAIKVPPSINELIDAYRYSNMLSGPQTQERNIGYNMTTTFFTRPYEIGIRGMIDYVQSGLRGKEREAYINDVAIYYKHAFNAIPDALMAFKNAWQMKPGEIMGKPEIGIEYKTPFEQARAKQIPKVLTIIQRFMEASDKFNSAIIGVGEYAIQKERGLSDIEAHEKARNLAENYLLRDKLDPNDPSLSYFSEALSGLGKMIEYGRKIPVAGRILSWFVPFLRTPINLGIQMVERSPVGWARSNIDLESASKLVGGAVFTGIGALFAYLGETTWAPPAGAKEKEWFYASGRKPFSVKVGEKWVPLWYLGPFALAFGIPAAVKYYTEESKQSLTDSTIEEIGRIAMGVGRFIGSQTSAQSIGNFFSLMAGDIDFTFVNQIGFMLGQAIPANAMIRYINKAIDPIYRKAEGIWEQVIKDIPFLSKELPTRKTPFMEESKRDFFNLFVPYDIGISKEEYESMYPFIKMEQRENYLNNKMNELIKKMEEGEFKDKHFDEMIKIFEATPKVFE